MERTVGKLSQGRSEEPLVETTCYISGCNTRKWNIRTRLVDTTSRGV